MSKPSSEAPCEHGRRTSPISLARRLAPALLLAALCAPCSAQKAEEPAAAAAAAKTARETAARELIERAQATVAPLGAGRVQGAVEFFTAPDATVIHVILTGLEPGAHGFHLHEYGNCSASDGSSAGAHVNPGGHEHGGPKDPAEQRHAGDLGNVLAKEDGSVDQWLKSGEFKLDGVVSVLGKAVVVHQEPDDYESQPAGASGDPIACGVVEPAA